MKLEKAIQKQIDDIMDTFRFDRCVKIMGFLKSIGEPHPKDWFDGDHAVEFALRLDARHCLEDVAKAIRKKGIKSAFMCRSYFKGYATKGKDDEGKWVRLDLVFGIDSFNEGISYED